MLVRLDSKCQLAQRFSRNLVWPVCCTSNSPASPMCSPMVLKGPSICQTEANKILKLAFIILRKMGSALFSSQKKRSFLQPQASNNAQWMLDTSCYHHHHHHHHYDHPPPLPQIKGTAISKVHNTEADQCDYGEPLLVLLDSLLFILKIHFAGIKVKFSNSQLVQTQKQKAEWWLPEAGGWEGAVYKGISSFSFAGWRVLETGCSTMWMYVTAHLKTAQ